MRERNRKPIASCCKFPQFTTMNVIDGQAVIERDFSLIFYSLTVDNILTIIVLLILAGVTIAMLSGKNGILSRATETRGQNAYASASEQARLAYMAVKTEIIAQKTSNAGYKANDATNAGKLKDMVVNELKGAEWTKEPVALSGSTITMIYSNTSLKAGAISEKPAEDGKITFKIKLGEKDAELYEDDILVSGSTGGDTPVTPTVTSVTELREGDEVIYTDQNGNEIPCIVLYDSTGSNGIQVISKDTVESNITLGSSNFNDSKASYNTAIATLNSAAQSYMNTNLSPANGARCVGSSPSETPVTSEDDTGTYTNDYDYFRTSTDYNNQFKVASANNTDTTNEDYLQMKKSNIDCYDISKRYWLASRYVTADSYSTDFDVRFVYSNGDFFGHYLCYVGSNERTDSNYDSNGLRPIFTLKSDIHYTDDGTTKTLVQ